MDNFGILNSENGNPTAITYNGIRILILHPDAERNKQMTEIVVDVLNREISETRINAKLEDMGLLGQD